MGEEVKMVDYDDGDGGGEEGHVFEWEMGLPSVDDLTPLSQPLIPLELASAFSISPEPRRSILEVTQASENTFSTLRGALSQALLSSCCFNFKSFAEEGTREAVVVECNEGSDQRKMRRVENGEGVEESADNCNDDASARISKRPRMVWTPQLHKRFVEVVARLGIKNAVPKTIMQLMNVEGLTRENVASHLQKYRLYVKRMQHDGPSLSSSSDHFFASQGLHESAIGGSGNGQVPVPMPYPPPQMPPMPMLGMAHMGMPGAPVPYHHHHPYNVVQQDWSGNTFSSVASYHHVTPNDK